MKGKLVILGGGESGVGTAILARNKGIDVFLSDSNSLNRDKKQTLLDYNIDFEEGGHSLENIITAKLIVKSPGIPEQVNIIKLLKSKGIQIISDIEFAYKYTNAKIVAVTGTNGKTTTTLLIGHILEKAGLDVLIAGNIGVSFARSIAERDYDYIVLEVSSFQLDYIKDFRPNIAIILNITSDHLERYDYKLDAYSKSKKRVTMNQNKSDFLIYNDDDFLLQDIQTKAKLFPISLVRENYIQGGSYNNREINIKLNNKTMKIQELALQGKHNIFNSMAAAVAARVFEVNDVVIRQSLIDFENIEHRLEHVLTVHGIDFINDSKATNVNACWYALESVDKDIVWIVGGMDKGNDYTELLELVKTKVKAIVCLGINNKKIHDVFKTNTENIVDVNNMQEAVNIAYSFANKGDVVLLSPACASFDLFKNFEERGTEFKNQVRKL